MTNAIQAHKVIGVTERGVIVDVNGQTRSLSWSLLMAACEQDDRDLAAVYQNINRQARAIAADGPVVVYVKRDDTNVWWVAGVRALYGGGVANYRRRRDEGGTHANHMLAACEAHDICERLGSRVARRE